MVNGGDNGPALEGSHGIIKNHTIFGAYVSVGVQIEHPLNNENGVFNGLVSVHGLTHTRGTELGPAGTPYYWIVQESPSQNLSVTSCSAAVKSSAVVLEIILLYCFSVISM